MKPVIVFVAAFVVATAGGTGAKMMLAKPAAAANDSTAAHGDSTAAAHKGETAIDTAAVASGAPVTPPVDTALHAVNPAAHDTSNHAAAATPLAPVQAGTAIATKQVNDTAKERVIAKMFASMDAKQAAKVLEHMEDNDVSVILGYVGPRQAASIMGALPPERVAKVSKLAMLGGGAK